MVLKRLEKKREIVHLRDLQQKSFDYQSQLEEMNILRIQEVACEWKRKELESARAMNENLKRERQKQIIDLRRTAEYEVIEVQKISYEKGLKEKQDILKKNQKYCNELLKQIDEKEKGRINKIQQKFKDSEYQRLQQIKDKESEEHLAKKIDKLR